VSKQDNQPSPGLDLAGQLIDVMRSGLASRQNAPIRVHTEDEKMDAAATLAAYNDLPPEYQDAVVESFLNRMDQQMARRNAAAAVETRKSNDVARKNSGGRIASLVICLAMAIPLTAIASSAFGLTGLVIVWVGIIIIALAFGFGGRR